MKVIHVPFCFYPDPVGGTEVYVEALATRQQTQGMEVVVAAPAEEAESYTHNGLRVRRYPLAPNIADPIELYDEGDAAAAEAFGAIVRDEQPDLVHLHALTRGVSLRLLRVVKRTRIPVVYTYHTPTGSCQRGTLMRWGADVCDGRLDPDLCTRCTLHGLGLVRPLANSIGRLPAGLGRSFGSALRPGRVWTALRMRTLVETRLATVRAFWTEVDRIVAVAEWVRRLLELNGVSAHKITLSRQGLVQPPVSTTGDGAPPAPAGLLRMAFFGRLHPAKGLHVLIQAMRMAPRLPATLDVFGVSQDLAGAKYARHLYALADGDARIVFHAPILPDQVAARLASYDVLAVPSLCIESGPLVVLDAFAAGTPVLGSRLGGIAELVTHNTDGWLVEPASPVAWRDALHRLSEDRTILDRLRIGIRVPRTMDLVAAEMEELYRVTVGV